MGLSPTVRGVSAVQIELAFQGDSCMMREAAHMRSNEAGGLPSNSAFREGPDALTWFQRKAAESMIVRGHACRMRRACTSTMQETRVIDLPIARRQPLRREGCCRCFWCGRAAESAVQGEAQTACVSSR